MNGRTTQKLRSGGLGLLALMGLVLTASPSASDAQGEPIPAVVDASSLPDAVVSAAAAADRLDSDAGHGADLDSSAHGPLVGVDGAATALAIHDYATALSLTEGQGGEPGDDGRFRVGALRGRALRRAGRPAEAVTTLEPLWSDRRLRRAFPAEILGFELALAKLEAAASMDTVAADALRTDAVSILDDVRKMSPIRNFARVRVTQAKAMASIEGASANATRAAARKAAKALGSIISDYPNHPDVGWLLVEQARALARAGKDDDAGDLYRSIHINRAGEPEADVAWTELQALAATSNRVRGVPLSTNEKLDQAMAARGLRWVETSREILDEVIESTESSSVRMRARSSRAWTAYKQRDFEQCADDLRPSFEATGSIDTRDRLLRCLERGAMYDEALEIHEADIRSKRKWTRLSALWDAVNLAVRAGQYGRAERYLDAYERQTKGNRQSRVWLHAWLPMRLGRVDEAIEKFEDAERYSSDRTRARYFRGKLLLNHAEGAKQLEGAAVLTDLIERDPLDYYGLLARQRLLDAEREVPDAPSLEPNRGEPTHPTRAETTATLSQLNTEFGDAWPEIRRMKQFYAAGYLEEARRELRVAVQGFETRGKKAGGVRNESFLVGLGWKANWSYPRIRPSRDAFKTMRTRESVEALEAGFRELARGLDEPYRFAKLSSSADGEWKARWHPRAFRAAVEREARLYDIDPIHMWSLMYTESRFRRFVVSPVGARGALQIMPWTAQQLAERLGELERGGSFDDDTLFDIDTNAHLAGYYVAELLKKFHGQPPMAYASYNGGPSNVQRWLEAKAASGDAVTLERDVFVEEIAFRESYRYARRVSEVSAAYALMYRGELPRWTNVIDADVEDNIAF